MVRPNLIDGLLSYYVPVAHQVFSYLDVTEVLALARVNKNIRFALAGDPRVLRAKRFVQVHYFRPVSVKRAVCDYERAFDETTLDIILNGASYELDFVWRLCFEWTIGVYHAHHRGLEWFHEGFAQSWIFGKVHHAAWFAREYRYNYILYKYAGYTVSRATADHCLFIYHRECKVDRMGQVPNFFAPNEIAFCMFRAAVVRDDIEAIERALASRTTGTRFENSSFDCYIHKTDTLASTRVRKHLHGRA